MICHDFTSCLKQIGSQKGSKPNMVRQAYLHMFSKNLAIAGVLHIFPKLLNFCAGNFR